jgi:hypothetical protein
VANFLFLMAPALRRHWAEFLGKKTRWDAPLAALWILTLFFMFRNCFFLVDVDSHSTYLYAQKLWLEHATSVFASPALDIRVFAPHFNAVPYALGLALFPHELLFPQLVAAFWTVIVVLLVFGYVGFRLGRMYALAAVMLCLFNDHMFFSGENVCCIINSALIALLFAAAYNFWEASHRKDPFRLLLALVFLSQLPANKYQALYVFAGLLVLGMVLKDNVQNFGLVMANRRWLLGLIAALGISGLWCLKNYLATGNPFFPILAGDMHTLGWTKDMANIFNKVYAGPLTFGQTMKFLSYLFVWPGVNAAKITGMLILLLPVWMMLCLRSKKFDMEAFKEICFWLSVALIALIGLCMVSFVDPRVYRYPIAVMAVASVFGLRFILEQGVGLPSRWASCLAVLVALAGFKVVFSHDIGRPTIQQNIAVLTNRLHTQDVLSRYYPDNSIAASAKDDPRFSSAAWDTGIGGVTPLSAYLLPTRPQLGLWHTTAVQWDSYSNAQAIIDDLQAQGIQWVMSVKDGRLNFESDRDYAQRAVGFDRYPKELFYNYGFPQELATVKY